MRPRVLNGACGGLLRPLKTLCKTCTFANRIGSKKGVGNFSRVASIVQMGPARLHPLINRSVLAFEMSSNANAVALQGLALGHLN
jgi:hypothetical protein